ncbi:MAG: DUF6106 family protein [Clostridia bacterium]
MLNYSMDIFLEFLIKRKRSPKNIAIIIGSIFLAVLLIYLAGAILPTYFGSTSVSIVFFLLCGCVYGIYWVVCQQNIEYEYAFTNGDLSIDKIMSQKSRKRLTSFDCKDIEDIGDYTPDLPALKNKNFEHKIFASVYESGDDAVYVIARSKKTGYTLLVFDPSEKMVDAIKNSIPRHLRIQVFGK